MVLMGDFNSRTGTSADFVINDDVTHIPVPDLYVPDTDVILRNSLDEKICTYGNDLLDLCRTTGLKIANGRVLGDSTGKFTCYKYNGSSTVDYVVTDLTTLSKLMYFKVDNLIGDLSDHCKISFGLSVSCMNSDCTEGGDLTKAPKKFKWHIGAEQQIRNLLMSDPKQAELHSLLAENIANTDTTVDSINKLLCTTASKCLKKISTKVPSKKRWFNTNCSNLRSQVRHLGKKLCRDPQNAPLRAAFASTKNYIDQLLRKPKHNSN